MEVPSSERNRGIYIVETEDTYWIGCFNQKGESQSLVAEHLLKKVKIQNEETGGIECSILR